MPTLTIPDVELRYIQHGSGPDIVWLPGGDEVAEAWDNQFAAFGREFPRHFNGPARSRTDSVAKASTVDYCRYGRRLRAANQGKMRSAGSSGRAVYGLSHGPASARLTIPSWCVLLSPWAPPRRRLDFHEIG